MMETGGGRLGCWEGLCSYAKSIPLPSFFYLLCDQLENTTYFTVHVSPLLISWYHIPEKAATLHESKLQYTIE